MPDPLHYGSPDTVFGIVTERLPDGGVKITVPRQSALLGMAVHVIPSMKFDRLIVTLDSRSLTILEPMRDDARTNCVWPIEEVGVIHPNRYARGIYVTITGRDGFDLIPDCPKEIVRHVGELLERTLAELRAKAVPPPENLFPTEKHFGVVTQPLNDGGVKFTIPYGLGTLASVLEPLSGFPHRSVITLDRTGLTITELHGQASGQVVHVGARTGTRTSHWPLEDIGEIRRNRYSRGVYVSIPGKANFDLLTDLKERVVHFVADRLEQTLAALRVPKKVEEL